MSKPRTSTVPQEHAPGPVAWLEDAAVKMVLARIAALRHEEEDAELSIVRPTEESLLETRKLLQDAYAQIRVFPSAAATASSDGGIYLYWQKPGRALQLTVAPGRSSPKTLYHRTPAASGLERNVSATDLAHWINWFAIVSPAPQPPTTSSPSSAGPT